METFDYTDELINAEESNKPIETIAKKQVNHLEIDPEIPGQKWCVISFLNEQGQYNKPMMGLKIRGSYETEQEAIDRAAFLHTKDPYFDGYIHRVGYWGPIRPNALDCEKVLYDDKHLQKIMDEEKKRKISNNEKENELNELNELAKMHKDTMKHSQQEYKERVKSKILEGITDHGTLPFNTNETKKNKPEKTDRLSKCKARLAAKLQKNNSENKNEQGLTTEEKLNLMNKMLK
jgi:hypothetical protein